MGLRWRMMPHLSMMSQPMETLNSSTLLSPRATREAKIAKSVFCVLERLMRSFLFRSEIWVWAESIWAWAELLWACKLSFWACSKLSIRDCIFFHTESTILLRFDGGSRSSILLSLLLPYSANRFMITSTDYNSEIKFCGSGGHLLCLLLMAAVLTLGRRATHASHVGRTSIYS